MRTLLAGLGAFRRNPMAIVPISAEGLCLAVAILIGFLPARATVAAAGAVFPLDVYFDVKHALGATSNWVVFGLAVCASIVVRSAVLVGTLYLAGPTDSRFVDVWRPAVRLVAVTALMFLPVAVLFFAGTATRYAPFIWLAAPIGLVIALVRARRGLGIDVGDGAPRGEATPEAAPYLAYAYLVALSGAAISFIGDRSTILAALLVLSLGPVHALFLLGWREHATAEVYPGGGFFSLTATVVIGGMLLVGTFYDRIVRSPTPVARTQRSGSIALLGGSDSTNETGALTELDVRSLGYPRDRARLLSYEPTRAYSSADTHQDLDTVVRVVADQVERVPDLEAVVGHSQAALIVDRMLAENLAVPGAVSFAPPPPRPPRLEVPSSGVNGLGKPGGDLARGLSFVLRLVGAPGFDLDAPAAPVRLEAVVVPRTSAPRLAVWALADSVWLDGDWRRPGESNVVAITDHVGVTRNGHALSAARDFLAARPVQPDTGSWRGILVPILRYTFEPWRPETP